MNYQIDEIISCYAVDKNGTRTPIEFGKISNIEAECSLDGSKQVSITIPPNEKEELFKITIQEKGDKELNELYNYWLSTETEDQNIDWTKDNDFICNTDNDEIKIDTQIMELDLLDDQELKIF
jgi:hypothetical protein